MSASGGCGEHRAEVAVPRMRDEAGPEVGEGEGDSAAERVQGAGAVGDGHGAPLFEPAAFRRERFRLGGLGGVIV